MKQSAKTLFCSVLLLVIMVSCQKDYSYESSLKNAIITGFDQRKCACCGGLIINFAGNTQSGQGIEYLVENNPIELGIEPLTASFPIACKVEAVVVDRCISGFIRITKLER